MQSHCNWARQQLSGSNLHNHPAEVGAALSARITAKVKARTAADVFRPVSTIVDVLFEDLPDVPCPSLPWSTEPDQPIDAARNFDQKIPWTWTSNLLNGSSRLS